MHSIKNCWTLFNIGRIYVFVNINRCIENSRYVVCILNWSIIKLHIFYRLLLSCYYNDSFVLKKEKCNEIFCRVNKIKISFFPPKGVFQFNFLFVITALYIGIDNEWAI